MGVPELQEIAKIVASTTGDAKEAIIIYIVAETFMTLIAFSAIVLVAALIVRAVISYNYATYTVEELKSALGTYNLTNKNVFEITELIRKDVERKKNEEDEKYRKIEEERSSRINNRY